MVDAWDSGSHVFQDVRVQVPFPAIMILFEFVSILFLGIILFIFIHNFVLYYFYSSLPREYNSLYNLIYLSALFSSVFGVLHLFLKPSTSLYTYLSEIFLLTGNIILLYLKNFITRSRKDRYFFLVYVIIIFSLFTTYLVTQHQILLTILYMLIILYSLYQSIFSIVGFSRKIDPFYNNFYEFSFPIWSVANFMIAILLTAKILSGNISYINSFLSLVISLGAMYSRMKYVFVLRKKLSEENVRLNMLYQTIVDELMVAKKIVDKLLPYNHEIRELDFAAYFKPAIAVGGDFYDIIRISNNKFLVYIADVAGHGVSASIIVAMLKTMILKNVMFFENMSSLEAKLEEIAKRINLDLITFIRDTGRYTTLFLALINTKDNEIYYVNSGHPEVIFWNSKVNEPFFLSSTSPILGIVEKIEAISANFTFSKGDFLILFSDGITSITNKKGEMLLTNGLVNIIKNNITPDISSKELLNKIVSGIESFANTESFLDDATLFIIKL